MFNKFTFQHFDAYFASYRRLFSSTADMVIMNLGSPKTELDSDSQSNAQLLDTVDTVHYE
jgi:dihydroorotate dehydrogenase